ncbi:MAG: RluA family pseudouridine synthase [Deltaproteobacteria bacterium]|nr:MAG: RluA family pseudouridine synthase [Deltaproteobacteria bacterium]
MPVTFRIRPDDEGLRLDKFLRRELKHVPLSHIFKLLRTRKVRLNERRGRPEDRLRAGDTVVVRGDPERLFGTQRTVGRGAPTTRRDFEVLYEDAHLLAVSKPPGLAIHPGTGVHGATLVDQVRAYLGIEAETEGFKASPAHRLDKETSGVVLVAKSRQCMTRLADAFAARQVEKVYLAVVKGRMPARRGEIDLALKEHQQTRRSKVLHGPHYQAAQTRWVQRKSTGTVSLLEVHPGTGRTHQIRRHLASTGHPIVGDRRYGDFPFNREARAEWGVRRHLLHAWRLCLTHPFEEETLRIEAPLPADLREALEAMGLR